MKIVKLLNQISCQTSAWSYSTFTTAHCNYIVTIIITFLSCKKCSHYHTVVLHNCKLKVSQDIHVLSIHSYSYSLCCAKSSYICKNHGFFHRKMNYGTILPLLNACTGAIESQPACVGSYSNSWLSHAYLCSLKFIS